MPDDGPITSEFTDDPEMTILITEFVESLPARARGILERIDQGAVDQARTMAHQLKGAGGGYGFPCITDAARVIELAIHEQRLVDARTAAQALVTLCARVAP